MRTPLSVAVGIALVAALVACDDEPTRGSDDDAYAVGPGDEYVAIGDSYTAFGTGAPADDDGCGTAVGNYPHRVAEATGVELVDNSCGSANTSRLRQPQPLPTALHPPQLTGLDADTDVVTIRIGANDYNLFADLVRCATLVAPSGSPCADADAIAGAAGAGPRLRAVEDNLSSALEDIQARAPDARIIVVGYPEIVPREGTCDLLPLAPGDYEWARRITEGLSRALEAAAAERDLTFIDVAAATEGHDICADEPWIAGVRAPRGRATPWHPYPEEAMVVAELILAELQEQ